MKYVDRKQGDHVQYMVDARWWCLKWQMVGAGIINGRW